MAPSTPYDAKGLLKAAIRDDNPVVYFEHKYLYRRAKGPVPEGDEIVPIGVAAIRRPGTDATLVTYGAMVQPSLEAADRLAKEGVEVEVIDLRTLMPLRQGGAVHVDRENEPAADRPRRREDARHRLGAGGDRRGGAIRHTRCARHARDVPGYTLSVFPGARAVHSAGRRQNHRSAPPAGRILENWRIQWLADGTSWCDCVWRFCRWRCRRRIRIAAQTEEAQRVQESVTVFNEIMGAPDKAIPNSVLEKAEGIAVFPGTIKGGFIVGAQHGRGILSARVENSREWSAPGFMTLTGGSIGAQIGAQAVDVVLVVMNRRGFRSW